MFTKEQFQELTFDQKKEVMEWRAKFHAKKAKATAEIKRIKKNGYNSFHKYHYATESDVKDEIRSILLENNLSITNNLLNREETTVATKQGQATKTDVKMEFTITDTETGYFENYIHDGVAVDNSDKGIYKSYSNTIKYFLMDTFLIPTGDDVEKDAPELSQKPAQGAQKPNGNPSQGQRQQTPSSGGESLFKQIMSAEDTLAELAGTDKPQIRAELKGKFGTLPMYKQLDDGQAALVLGQLNKWIDKYKHPQG
jgi:hypothetical protein